MVRIHTTQMKIQMRLLTTKFMKLIWPTKWIVKIWKGNYPICTTRIILTTLQTIILIVYKINHKAALMKKPMTCSSLAVIGKLSEMLTSHQSNRLSSPSLMMTKRMSLKCASTNPSSPRNQARSAPLAHLLPHLTRCFRVRKVLWLTLTQWLKRDAPLTWVKEWHPQRDSRPISKTGYAIKRELK